MDTQHIRWAVKRRDKCQIGSFEWLAWHRGAWKLLQLSCGVPVIEWTEYPKRARE